MKTRQRMRVRFAAVAALVLLLTACVSAPQSAQLLQSQAEHQAAGLSVSAVNLEHIPFFPQEDYQCGPAALATLLQASDVVVSPEELVSRVYVPARQGSLQVEMLAAPRAYQRASYQLDGSLTSLLREVQHGRPVLVMQNLGLSFYPQWHYAVVVGYDLDAGEVLLRSGTTREYWMPLSVFERTWQRAEHWAALVLKAGEMPLDANELRYFEAVAALERLNSADLVERYYQTGLQRWPQSAVLGMGLGNLYYGAGRYDAAVTSYRQLLQHHSDYAIAHNNLARTLLRLNRQPEALQHAQQAVALGGRYAEMFQETLELALMEQ